jgi:hypothetical protein
VNASSNFSSCYYQEVSRDSSVGIATLLEAGRSGNRIPVGVEIFRNLPDRPGAHTTSYAKGTESFPGVKRPGRDADHPPPSMCQGHERVELYLLLTLWAFVACYRENFTFT